MGRATVTKRWTFDAAHQLLHHDGKCARRHGHTYSLTVAVEGEIAPADRSAKEGMVIDYDDLGRVWRERLEPLLDHQDLNETIGPPTTAENIAAWALRVVTDAGVPAAWVEVSETPATTARVNA